MSDDRMYKDGDIVWVKLGSHWWPGEVTGPHRQPEGLVKHLKRKPYCVVKFFQEDAYEYVKNAKQVYPFQCSMKEEFISKGLAFYNAKKKFMEKFPADVELAERLTLTAVTNSGSSSHSSNADDTLIINNRPDSIVKAILGQARHTPLLGRGGGGIGGCSDGNNAGPYSAGNNVRRSGDSVTKILNITSQRLGNDSNSKLNTHCASVNTTPTAYNSSTKVGNKFSNDRTTAATGSSLSGSVTTPNTGAAIINAGSAGNVYRCHLCDFTSLRQNVIIFHRKSHSSGGGGGGGSGGSATIASGSTLRNTTTTAISKTSLTKDALNAVRNPTCTPPTTTTSTVTASSTTTTTPLTTKRSNNTAKESHTLAFETPVGVTVSGMQRRKLHQHDEDTTVNPAAAAVAADDDDADDGDVAISPIATTHKRSTTAAEQLTCNTPPNSNITVTLSELPMMSPNGSGSGSGSGSSSSNSNGNSNSAIGRLPKKKEFALSQRVLRSSPHLVSDLAEITLPTPSPSAATFAPLVRNNKMLLESTHVRTVKSPTTPEETVDIRPPPVAQPQPMVSIPKRNSEEIRQSLLADWSDEEKEDEEDEYSSSKELGKELEAGKEQNSAALHSTQTANDNSNVPTVPSTTPPPPPPPPLSASSTSAIGQEVTSDNVVEISTKSKRIRNIPKKDRRDIVLREFNNEQHVRNNSTASTLSFSSSSGVGGGGGAGGSGSGSGGASTGDTPPIVNLDSASSSSSDSVVVVEEPPVVMAVEIINVNAPHERETTAVDLKPIAAIEPPALEQPVVVPPELPVEVSNHSQTQNIAEKAAVSVGGKSVVGAATATSCFDFEEDDDDNETDILTSIANFKKQYLTNALPEKSLMDTNSKSIGVTPALVKEQRNGIASGLIDGRHRNKDDDQLVAEIETLLSQTNNSVVTANIDVTLRSDTSRDDEALVKALPIKERGKRIFKSRNRSPVEQEQTLLVDNANISGGSDGIVAVSDACEKEALTHAVTVKETISDAPNIETAETAIVSLNKSEHEAEETDNVPHAATVSTNGEHKMRNGMNISSSNGVPLDINVETSEKVDTVEKSDRLESTLNPNVVSEENIALEETTKVEEADAAADYEDDDAEEAIPIIRHSPVEIYRRPSTDVVDDRAAIMEEEEDMLNATDEQNYTHKLIEENKPEMDDGLGDEVLAAVVASVSANAEGSHSRFNSPMDENSSAGAEFGSPTSMLDDERLPLLSGSNSNPISTPTQIDEISKQPCEESDSLPQSKNDSAVEEECGETDSIAAAVAEDPQENAEDMERTDNLAKTNVVDEEKEIDTTPANSVTDETEASTAKSIPLANKHQRKSIEELTMSESHSNSSLQQKSIPAANSEDLNETHRTVVEQTKDTPKSANENAEGNAIMPAATQEPTTTPISNIEKEPQTEETTSVTVQTPSNAAVEVKSEEMVVISPTAEGRSSSPELSEKKPKRKRRSIMKITPRRSELARIGVPSQLQSNAASSATANGEEAKSVSEPPGAAVVVDGQKEKLSLPVNDEASIPLNVENIASANKNSSEKEQPLATETPAPVTTPIATVATPLIAAKDNENITDGKMCESVVLPANTMDASNKLALPPPSTTAHTPITSVMPEKVRINVDIANPLSSQIADILAITASNNAQQQQLALAALAARKRTPSPSISKTKVSPTRAQTPTTLLKRKSSFEADIPSFVIERAPKKSKSHTTSTSSSSSTPTPTPTLTPTSTPTTTPASTPKEELITVFDISNMPILLSNEQTPTDSVQYVLASGAVDDQPPPHTPSTPQLIKSQQQRAATRTKSTGNSSTKRNTPKFTETPQTKQIGTDARGNKYVIIKPPTADLSLQANTPTATLSNTFSIGSNVTVRAIGDASTNTNTNTNVTLTTNTSNASTTAVGAKTQTPLTKAPSSTKPKSPAAAATGGRKHAGNTITLPHHGSAVKSQTKSSTEAVVGGHGTGQTRRRMAQQMPMQRRLTQTEMPLITIKQMIGDRRRLSATVDVVTGGSGSGSVATTTASAAAAAALGLVGSTPAKVPKPLSGENFATAQQQLMQLKQQQQQQRDANVVGSPVVHHLHNRKPRKQPQQHRTATQQQQQQHQHQQQPQQQPQPLQNSSQKKQTIAGDGLTSTQKSRQRQQNQQQQQQRQQHQQQRQQQLQMQQQHQQPKQQQQQQNLIQHQQIIVPAPVQSPPQPSQQQHQQHQQQQQQTQMQQQQQQTQAQSQQPHETPVQSTTINEEQLLQIQSEEQIDGASNILAVPTQPIPGYNETFLLCTLVNNNYKPIDNVPLYLDHDLNQLVPVPLEALDGQPHLIVQQPPAAEETQQQLQHQQQQQQQQQQQEQQQQQNQVPKLDVLKTAETADSSRRQQLICLPHGEHANTSLIDGTDTTTSTKQLCEMDTTLVATTTPTATATQLMEGTVSNAAENTTSTIVSDSEQDAAAAAAQMAVFLPQTDQNAEIVADNAVILNIEGQQIILDAATFAHLLANPDANTQLITDDGTEFVLTREVLAALEAQQEIVAAAAAQADNAAGGGGDGMQVSVADGQSVDAGGTDILAVALAGSDLYGNEVLEIETSQGLQLMSSDGTLMFHPSALPQPHLTPPITAQTSETNALLNQTPIMSTLEKPSTASSVNKRKAGIDITGTTNALVGGSAGAALLGNAVSANNLADSLAVIGVNTQSSSVPASLELPITVTNPAIAPKISTVPAATPTELELVQFQPTRTIAAAIAQEGRIYNDPGS